MNKDEPACPICEGLGLLSRISGPDSRREEPCYQCGGSGRHSDALYAKLSGLDRERAADNAQKALDTYWRNQHGLA